MYLSLVTLRFYDIIFTREEGEKAQGNGDTFIQPTVSITQIMNDAPSSRALFVSLTGFILYGP